MPEKSKPLLIRLAILLLALVLTSGCSTLGNISDSIFGDDGQEIDAVPQELAQEGMESLKGRRFSDAVDKFQTLKDRYPYSRYAILAELKIADALYLKGDYVEALASYQEFERLHPKNEAVPYVIYQQGMCLYEQMTGYDRDQTPVVHAIQTFNRLQNMYPGTRYAAMALARTTDAQNSLAHHEFYVGEYYYKKKAYKAAQGRFLSLVKNYPDTGFHARSLDYIKVCRAKMAVEESRKKETEPEDIPPPKKEDLENLAREDKEREREERLADDKGPEDKPKEYAFLPHDDAKEREEKLPDEEPEEYTFVAHKEEKSERLDDKPSPEEKPREYKFLANKKEPGEPRDRPLPPPNNRQADADRELDDRDTGRSINRMANNRFDRDGAQPRSLDRPMEPARERTDVRPPNNQFEDERRTNRDAFQDDDDFPRPNAYGENDRVKSRDEFDAGAEPPPPLARREAIATESNTLDRPGTPPNADTDLPRVARNRVEAEKPDSFPPEPRRNNGFQKIQDERTEPPSLRQDDGFQRFEGSSVKPPPPNVAGRKRTEMPTPEPQALEPRTFDEPPVLDEPRTSENLDETPAPRPRFQEPEVEPARPEPPPVIEVVEKNKTKPEVVAKPAEKKKKPAPPVRESKPRSEPRPEPEPVTVKNTTDQAPRHGASGVGHLASRLGDKRPNIYVDDSSEPRGQGTLREEKDADQTPGEHQFSVTGVGNLAGALKDKIRQ